MKPHPLVRHSFAACIPVSLRLRLTFSLPLASWPRTDPAHRRGERHWRAGAADRVPGRGSSNGCSLALLACMSARGMGAVLCCRTCALKALLQCNAHTRLTSPCNPIPCLSVILTGQHVQLHGPVQGDGLRPLHERPGARLCSLFAPRLLRVPCFCPHVACCRFVESAADCHALVAHRSLVLFSCRCFR